ncbi:hypothetical protein [Vogesella fluminis]|uniref:Alginate export domain-containing protein n=2 Tax=Vogesella fluminis TaxID=1069161 RepID=A0ABQ3HFN3_9NEIS|nr:hypothetical protein [Vogesella fluminis]GHD79628.1 hypothetical protein GCM10011419_23230 [Vogesella fluminis]
MKHLLPATLLAALPALAQTLPEQTLPELDATALALADATPDSTARPADGLRFIELAHDSSQWQLPGYARHSQRLSLAWRGQHNAAEGLQLAWAARQDWRQPGNGQPSGVLTVSDAYAAWQPDSTHQLALGRINVRHGVATGFNPTDFLREDAVRSLISADPASQRDNRQGTVMLRAQQWWDGGAANLLLAPALDSSPRRPTLQPDADATNRRTRWLASLSLPAWPLSPQWLLYHAAGNGTRLGANLSTVLGQATVLYGEWAGGHAPGSGWQNQLAGGAQYTWPNKLTLGLEWQYDGSALDAAQWAALARQPAAYLAYRAQQQQRGGLPTRRQWLLQACWQDVLPRLDLALLQHRDGHDHSSRLWLEARWRGTRTDYALQWLQQQGAPGSQYGTLPQQRSMQALARWFF